MAQVSHEPAFILRFDRVQVYMYLKTMGIGKNPGKAPRKVKQRQLNSSRVVYALEYHSYACALSRCARTSYTDGLVVVMFAIYLLLQYLFCNVTVIILPKR